MVCKNVTKVVISGPGWCIYLPKMFKTPLESYMIKNLKSIFFFKAIYSILSFPYPFRERKKEKKSKMTTV